MGLMKQAYDTYCTLEKIYGGQYSKDRKEPLVPVSHQIVNGDISITLNDQGEIITATLMDKFAQIIIPVTEQSAGRTGDTSCAHPLCDQIRFFSPRYAEKYQAYLTQLHVWEQSAYGHPKLHAIARYVEKGRILEDLESFGLITLDEKGLPTKEKLMICWKVETGIEEENPECWKDQSLFRSFIDYYAANQERESVFCMISGTYGPAALQHPKKIITTNANAKLISANDKSGFTYRGRFLQDSQALTVSYDASQKAHNAIHWLAANQGVHIGERTFLCWNPQGISLPQIHCPMLRGGGKTAKKFTEYKKELAETLWGWQERLPEDAGAVVAAFDAATSGRLALTYYTELLARDFLERLHDWDSICCWNNGIYGIQSPSLMQIIDCGFGTLRGSGEQQKFETPKELMRMQMQRLIGCRVDKAKMPLDIERALLARANNLQILEGGLRKKVLSTTCAVIRKYRFDTYKEEWEMALEPDRKDISYQFGRLLAVMEKIEKDTYNQGETRETNAIRVQSAFAQHPLRISTQVLGRLKEAYYPKLKPGIRAFYDKLIGEIMEIISQCSENQWNRPLGDTYLLGYYLQHNALYSKKEESEQEEEQ